MATPSVATFQTECERRLIDTHNLALHLGLRSREAIWKRVEAGKLPAPVYSGATITLWDRDALPDDTKEKV